MIIRIEDIENKKYNVIGVYGMLLSDKIVEQEQEDKPGPFIDKEHGPIKD